MAISSRTFEDEGQIARWLGHTLYLSTGWAPYELHRSDGTVAHFSSVDDVAYDLRVDMLRRGLTPIALEAAVRAGASPDEFADHDRANEWFMDAGLHRHPRADAYAAPVVDAEIVEDEGTAATRPDVDAIEAFGVQRGAPRTDVPALVAYVRHLEAQRAELATAIVEFEDTHARIDNGPCLWEWEERIRAGEFGEVD